MELFSEVYGCYFTVLAKVLEKAKNGLSKEAIEKHIFENAFYDSAFHLLPKLLSGEWNLLENKKDLYFSKLEAENIKRPMTILEKSWIKSILSDKRIKLFISPEELRVLDKSLNDILPIFYQSDIHTFDIAADGDPFEDKIYIDNFRKILQACNNKSVLKINYESGKQNRLAKHIVPYKINYSGRDDKFRLFALLVHKNRKYSSIILNLARIKSLETSDQVFTDNINLANYFKNNNKQNPVIFEISKQRNALERCMLQFASWEKQTFFDDKKNVFICQLYYDNLDETEILIRILSFGPVVKVLGPNRFLEQIKERVKKQFDLNSMQDFR